MALRTIREMGDPVLEKKAKVIKEVTPRIRTLAEDMLETMYETGGVGLAAPQVGILKRIVVIDVTEEQNEPLTMINPEIIEQDGEQTGFEGCLSVYEEEDFDALMKKLAAMDYLDPEARRIIRLASASVCELPVDIHGRVLLGKDLLRDYAIGHEITLIGVLDHFEIWDSTAYAKYDLAEGIHYGQKGGLS